MSKTDAIKSYLDYLVGKGSFILHAPPGLGREPDAGDYDLSDMLERELYITDKAKYKSRIEETKQKDAIHVLVYVITELMGLTPEEALIQFEVPGRAQEYIGKWKLEKVLEHIRMPPGIRKDNYRYLFSMVFPGRITYDEDEQTLEVYRRVLEGEIPKFPRNFLVRKGSIKLCVMLMQYISTHMRQDGPEDLYRTFSDTGEGYRILKDAKLYPACRKFFKSPLEFVHTMLVQARQANPLLYNFYSFKSAYVAAEKEVLRAEKGPKTP